MWRAGDFGLRAWGSGVGLRGWEVLGLTVEGMWLSGSSGLAWGAST